MNNQPRNDYPRPQFVREPWLNLNGEWAFAYDDKREGLDGKWYTHHKHFPMNIQVPFTFESTRSGIGDSSFHDVVWYRREFTVPESFTGKRVLLHFGAVDYEAMVWVNGQLAIQHEGGHTPFFADVTPLLQDGVNTVVVRAEDFGQDVFLPRGKQTWEEKSRGIFYTRTTGIWQTVWMEAVHEIHLANVAFTPDIDRNEIGIRYEMHNPLNKAVHLKIRISFQGESVAEDVLSIRNSEGSRKIKLSGLNDHSLDRFWSPEKPNLFDVTFELMMDDNVVDQVHSYFGMRKVSIENGRFCLNNRPYYMKLVLDQGYFPDGNLTPPSDEAIKQDVEWTKQLGFNGARKHQKVEDPRYLYWCDRLGLIVWGEMANAYDFSEEYARKFSLEWHEVVKRDYNHPCIVAWVPLNESWGVPNIQIDKRQQQHAMAMYYVTKSLDPTRLVVSNDGWEMVATDLFNIHDYEWKQDVLENRYRTVEKAVNAMPANRRLSVDGYPYAGQPILVTEFGGIIYKKSEGEGWGYSIAEDEEDYLARLRAVVNPLLQSDVVQGFCYTQLTDVEQEMNGLLTYDRKPKVPFEKIREIMKGRG